MPSSDPPTTSGPAGTGSESNVAPQSQAQAGPSSGNKGKAPESAPKTEQGKLSNAELKKQQKAEKAARRAQAIQEKQGPATVSPPVVASGSGPGPRPEGQRGGKAQQKRRGSMAADVRNVAIRGGVQKVAPVPVAPKEEDKTVEFFRHLYKTRTTSIAAAGKDVHPAVLALGLQMSSYTICGSCARLVATLQAFKRVSR